MSTLALRPSTALLGEHVTSDGIEEGIAPARGFLQELDWGLLHARGSRTERVLKDGLRVGRPVDDQWGRSESIDPDDVGDIADEGLGHRG